VLAVFAFLTAFYARQALRKQSREVAILAAQNERETGDRRRDQAPRVFTWAEAGTAPDPRTRASPGSSPMSGTPATGLSTTASSGSAMRASRLKWAVVAWIVAEDLGQLIAGLAELAEALGIRGPVQDAELAALRARRWLERSAAAALDEMGHDVTDRVLDVRGCQCRGN
jgi:hypothetical protein